MTGKGRKAKALDDVQLEPSNQAPRLVEIARDMYRVFRSTDGRTYAVERDGPNVAVTVGRHGRFATRLSRTFIESEGKAPSAAALDGAVRILDAYSEDTEPEDVYLRIAPSDLGVVLDLAAPDGRCVIVTADGWSIEGRSPVLFRRGKGLPLVDPVPGIEGLGKLQALLNARGDQFRLVIAWMVAALVPGRPYTILYLRGQQGSAKTSAARIIQSSIDPGASGPGSFPKDERDYAVRMHAAHVHAFDNLSTIQQWQSDILCRTATGDTFTTRELYSDDNLTVMSYQRPVILTAIDTVAMNSDLVERQLPVALHKIRAWNRRIERATLGSDAETDPGVLDQFAKAQPYILGSLLDLLVSVLANAKATRPESLPRMADFALILAALANAERSTTLARYREISHHALGDVADSDRFAAAVLAFMEHRDSWTGTAGELRDELTMQLGDREREHPPRGWPTDATRAGGRLPPIGPSPRVHALELPDFDPARPPRPWVPGPRCANDAGDAGDADSRQLTSCVVCQEPMTVIQSGQTTHPSCDPSPTVTAGGWPSDSVGAEANRPDRCTVQGCTQLARPGVRYCLKHGRRQP